MKNKNKTYTVLRNSAGCIIKGMMTEKEIKQATSNGEWTASQILDSVEYTPEEQAELNLSKCARRQK